MSRIRIIRGGPARRCDSCGGVMRVGVLVETRAGGLHAYHVSVCHACATRIGVAAETLENESEPEGATP